MKQANMFDFFGSQSDPICMELNKLKKAGVHVQIATFTITKNVYGLYEIENDDVHDCVSSLEGCYRYLCDHLKEGKN